MLKRSLLVLSPIILCLVLSRYPARAADGVFDEATPEILSSDGAARWDQAIEGQITDTDGRTLSRASAVLDGVEYFSDANGRFQLPGRNSNHSILFKKPGFRKLILSPQRGFLKIALERQVINGVYLQTGLLRQKASTYQTIMELMRTTELNAVTIDVKDDEGRVSSRLKPFINELHAKGLYTIARIVTFKDNVAPRKNHELAVMNGVTHAPWEDRNHVTYLNPYDPRAWDYVIRIAKAAVAEGFDEIQFDYVRFPTDGNRSTIAWNKDVTSTTRSAAIAGFLERARKELGAMGAYVAADVFGITAYDKNDSGIGQKLEVVSKHLDYICPMVYPSGFAKGTGGVSNPVDQPEAIVFDSIKRFRLRADESVVIRPWLQSFRDYAYNHRNYGANEIRDQIEGSDRAGGEGFLLWNAASRYSKAGLATKKTHHHSNKRRVLP